MTFENLDLPAFFLGGNLSMLAPVCNINSWYRNIIKQHDHNNKCQGTIILCRYFSDCFDQILFYQTSR